MTLFLCLFLLRIGTIVYKFGDLDEGDMFNTKPARYVKISETDAIVVMGSVFKIGTIHEFGPEESVIPLYCNKIELGLI